MDAITIPPEILRRLRVRKIRMFGHHPLVLDDPSRMWVIASGAVSVMTSHVAQGLPIGLQLITGVLQEERLLQVAHAYEQEARVMASRPAAVLVA